VEKQLLSLIPTNYQIVFIVGIILFGLILKNFDKILKGLSFFQKENNKIDNKKEKLKKYNAVATHHLDGELSTWINIKHKTIDSYKFTIAITKTEQEKRRWLSKHLLIIKLSTFYNDICIVNQMLKQAYIENDCHKLGMLNDVNFWIDGFYKAIDTYVSKSKKYLQHPQFVNLFEEFHAETEAFTEKEIRRVFNNPIYSDVSERVHAVKNVYSFAFHQTLNHIDYILKLNGRLTDSLKHWEIPINERY